MQFQFRAFVVRLILLLIISVLIMYDLLTLSGNEHIGEGGVALNTNHAGIALFFDF